MAVMAVLAAALWSVPTADDWIDGKATYYAPGIMERVAENRGRSLAGYVGGVALNRAGDLGRRVWLEWGEGEIDGPYLVVDCARELHFAEREDARLVVEVDAQTAWRHGFFRVGPVPVRVLFVEPEQVRVPA